MAYNRRNKLKQMKEIVELYCQEKKPGISTAFVYRNFIRPKYHISLTTLYAYLSIPVTRQLKAEEEKVCK
jgi:hypothetical protein